MLGRCGGPCVSNRRPPCAAGTHNAKCHVSHAQVLPPSVCNRSEPQQRCAGVTATCAMASEPEQSGLQAQPTPPQLMWAAPAATQEGDFGELPTLPQLIAAAEHRVSRQRCWNGSSRRGAAENGTAAMLQATAAAAHAESAQRRAAQTPCLAPQSAVPVDADEEAPEERSGSCVAAPGLAGCSVQAATAAGLADAFAAARQDACSNSEDVQEWAARALRTAGVRPMPPASQAQVGLAESMSAVHGGRGGALLASSLLMEDAEAEELYAMESEDYGMAAEESDRVTDGPAPPLHTLLAGAVAGAVSRTTTAPLDRLKVMLQASDATVGHRYNSLGAASRYIFEQGGLRGFWRGNGVNVLKAAPELAVRFYTFETLLTMLGGGQRLDKAHVPVLHRALAGASAGVTAQLVIYPLETIKTRVAVSCSSQYRGMVHCAMSTINYEGWASLYRGLGPSLAGIIPYCAVDLTVYSVLRDWYHRAYPGEHLSTMATLGIGAVSTTIGQVVSYPLQLIRTRLQAQGMKERAVVYKGALDCFKQTVAGEGIMGLYKGLLPNMLKALPAMSISYAVYERCRAFLLHHPAF